MAEKSIRGRKVDTTKVDMSHNQTCANRGHHSTANMSRTKQTGRRGASGSQRTTVSTLSRIRPPFNKAKRDAETQVYTKPTRVDSPRGAPDSPEKAAESGGDTEPCPPDDADEIEDAIEAETEIEDAIETETETEDEIEEGQLCERNDEGTGEDGDGAHESGGCVITGTQCADDVDFVDVE
jgi:hypothetical protein